jgi:hypothetical protein
MSHEFGGGHNVVTTLSQQVCIGMAETVMRAMRHFGVAAGCGKAPGNPLRAVLAAVEGAVIILWRRGRA